jgi:hypothetical protein
VHVLGRPRCAFTNQEVAVSAMVSWRMAVGEMRRPSAPGRGVAFCPTRDPPKPFSIVPSRAVMARGRDSLAFSLAWAEEGGADSGAGPGMAGAAKVAGQAW